MLKALARCSGGDSIKVKDWIYFDGRTGKNFCNIRWECYRKGRVKVDSKIFSSRNQKKIILISLNGEGHSQTAKSSEVITLKCFRYQVDQLYKHFQIPGPGNHQHLGNMSTNMTVDHVVSKCKQKRECVQLLYSGTFQQLMIEKMTWNHQKTMKTRGHKL